MGCTSSKRQDATIDRVLQKMEREEKAILKLLLLGAGDSGKTTIFKQMRYLYGAGFTTEAKKGMKLAIFQNIIEGARLITSKCGEFPGTSAIQEHTAVQAIKIVESTPIPPAALDEEVANAVLTLWADPDFQSVWEHRSKLDISEGFAVFARKLSAYPQWGGDDWLPDREDFLLGRIRTTGVVEETFAVGDKEFQLMDVGGQRNERRKWIHCFDGVTAVLFVVASSEYDQVLYENKSKNRLKEALDLFETMTNSEWFKNTTMILFLNKADLFREKLTRRKIPLNVSGEFSDAPKSYDFDEGILWIRDKFLDRNDNKDKIVWVHITTALDEGNIKVVIEAIKKTILQQVLQELSFYPKDPLRS